MQKSAPICLYDGRDHDLDVLGRTYKDRLRRNVSLPDSRTFALLSLPLYRSEFGYMGAATLLHVQGILL
jgi:hypothetical protein